MMSQLYITKTITVIILNLKDFDTTTMNLHPHAVRQLLWTWYSTATLHRTWPCVAWGRACAQNTHATPQDTVQHHMGVVHFFGVVNGRGIRIPV